MTSRAHCAWTAHWLNIRPFARLLHAGPLSWRYLLNGSKFDLCCKYTPTMSLTFPQLWLMESPRWLLLKSGRREQAVEALTRARGRYGTDAVAIQREVADIEASVNSQQGSGGEDGIYMASISQGTLHSAVIRLNFCLLISDTAEAFVLLLSVL